MPNSGTKSYSGQVAGTKTAVHDKPTTLYAVNFLNETAAVAYVQLFYLASGDVTVGTTTPQMAIGLPASGGLTWSFPQGWILGGAALTIACTTGAANSTGANVRVNLVYG